LPESVNEGVSSNEIARTGLRIGSFATGRIEKELLYFVNLTNEWLFFTFAPLRETSTML
jgi:hypothetical protein